MKRSKKIKYLIDLERVPKLSPKQALEIWKLTNEFLPQVCLWRDNDAVSIEALELAAYEYFRKQGESICLEELCLKCIQVYNKPCRYRSLYLV